jgi:hypothetical protein
MKILITSLYQETNSIRRAELFECLRRNVENDYLDEIHLFLEGQINLQELALTNALFGSSKLRLIPWNDRLKFCDLFAYSNHHLTSSLVVIANADIYFDQTLIYLDDYDLVGGLLCLSRWNVQADGSSIHFAHPGSQDAWIFQTPLPEFFCDFSLGVPACDNRLAWEAEQAGLRISNPSSSIRAHHLHLSQIRHYTESQRLNGQTKSIPPALLDIHHSPRAGTEFAETLADVAFFETMGYTIGQIEIGVSSHNNETRPFTIIPRELAGLYFTQVVAYAVSPVEIVFLNSGKLFILVAYDWDGYYSATAWLRQNASREGLPMVETKTGIGFEIWSLVAEAGRGLMIPTQVMLVASYLVRSHRRMHTPYSL